MLGWAAVAVVGMSFLGRPKRPFAPTKAELELTAQQEEAATSKCCAKTAWDVVFVLVANAHARNMNIGVILPSAIQVTSLIHSRV